MDKEKVFELVSDALAAKQMDNRFVSEFDTLINQDFVKLCDIEPGINDAMPMQKLQSIQREMRLIANCPELHSRSIGAVGGGFSSGKSTFINSFLSGTNVKLAVGLHPVTAIPSYVISDKKSEVKGITYRGGRFDISIDMYKEINHEFLKSLSFDLKDIIRYTTVLAPMKEGLFDHLCMIDTPGYDPSASGVTERDFETAREYIKDADFLIWLVSIEAGTMPKSDLEFLKKTDFCNTQDKPLYIVVTKAELRKESDIPDILDNIEESLDDADIQYAGISTYSAIKKIPIDYRKQDIIDFLKEHNKPSEKYSKLKGILYDVFKDYIGEIHRDSEERETNRWEVMNLRLGAFGSGRIGIDDSSSKLEDGLNSLLRYFKSKENLEERIARVRNLRDRFLSCLDKFCDNMGIEHKKVEYCTNCRGKLSGRGKSCPHCGILFDGTGKICPKCHKKLPIDSIFCYYCGKQLEEKKS